MKLDQPKLDQFTDIKIPEQPVKLRKSNRLFLPLDGKWYRLFLEGKKLWELRGVNGIFNLNTVREGGTVELRRGYQSDPLWGIITERLFVNSISEIPSPILHQTIPPEVRCNSDVKEFLKEYQDKYDRFILFKIDIIERDQK